MQTLIATMFTVRVIDLDTGFAPTQFTGLSFGDALVKAHDVAADFAQVQENIAANNADLCETGDPDEYTLATVPAVQVIVYERNETGHLVWTTAYEVRNGVSTHLRMR